jgi:uncharacterized protein YndB with AHSA1/START domain
MVDIVEELNIERPPDVVWAALVDFGSIGRWAPNVDHSCLTTDRAEGVGTVRRVQVGRNALLERVVEWEPRQRLGYTIEGLPTVIRSATNTWTLLGSGSATNVTLRSCVEVGSRPTQKLAARAFGRVLARASQQMLAGLQAYLEEESP